MDFTALRDAVTLFGDFLMRYALALVVVGALSMALLEAWKKVFDSRTKYHLRALLAWIGEDPRAYTELLHLASGVPLPDPQVTMVRHEEYKVRRSALPRDPELALATRELEEMLGRMQEAAEAALRDPKRYRSLYVFLAGGAGQKDVAEWEKAAYVLDVGAPEAAERARLLGRVHGAARHKLDAFELYTAQRWANSQQLIANALGAAILTAALFWQHSALKRPLGFGLVAGSLLLCAFGGMLAPVAKDLVSALRRAAAPRRARRA